MKKIAVFSSLLFAIITLAPACETVKNPNVQKQVAKSVIDVGLALCIAKNPDADEQLLKNICQFGDDLAPLVRDLLSAQKEGASRSKAACGK